MEQSLGREVVHLGRRDLNRVPTWVYLGFIILAEAVIGWSYNQFFFTRDLVMTAYGGQLDAAQAERMLQMVERFQWLGYLAGVPSVFVRLTLVALFLQLVMLFIESEPVSFGMVFRVAAIAHFAKITESVVGLLWFLHFEGSERTTRFLAGSPLSLSAFVDRDGWMAVFKMVSDSLSIGNVAWIIVVAVCLAAELRRPRWSLLATCFLAWAAMVAVRFALYQTVTALTS
jgi:hypothetical protein